MTLQVINKKQKYVRISNRVYENTWSDIVKDNAILKGSLGSIYNIDVADNLRKARIKSKCSDQVEAVID